MKVRVLLKIEDGNTPEVESMALSKDTAIVAIHAESWEEVPALISKGQDLATEAMENWKPEGVSEKEALVEHKKHYYAIHPSFEEMREEAQAYEDTEKGQRFIRSIDKAKEFTFKHSKGGLRVSEVDYLMNKHYNNLLYGYFDFTALAYRRGYMQGQRAAKKER